MLNGQRGVRFVEALPASDSLVHGDFLRVHVLRVILAGVLVEGMLYLRRLEASIVLDVQQLVRVEVVDAALLVDSHLLLNQVVSLDHPLPCH